MAYLVFARKYRPQTFDEVVGQDHVCKTLKNALKEQRVAHAYIFVGPKGTGKTSVARILAKALNCEKGPTAEPCGICPVCQDIAEGTDMDVIEIDGASNRGIDDIKELRENVKFAPGRSRSKVYIIDEVHMLSTDANNALLKTLEEPPAHVKFIFATTEPHKVIATVFSRCQRFDFRMIPLESIVARLQQICANEDIKADDAVLQEIARAAGGGMRDAQSILDQVVSFGIEGVAPRDIRQIIGSLDTEVIRGLTEAILVRDADTALSRLNDVLDGGTNLKELVSEILGYMRNAVIFKLCGSDSVMLAGISDEDAASFQTVFKTNDIDRILLNAKMLEDFLLKSRSLTCERVLLEITVVNMLRMDNFISVTELLNRANSPAAGTPGAAPPVENSKAARSRPQGGPSRGSARMEAAAPPADGEAVKLQKFMHLLGKEESLLSATLDAWGVQPGLEEGLLVLDFKRPTTLSEAQREVFGMHPEWSDIIERMAVQQLGREVKVSLAFLKAGAMPKQASAPEQPAPEPVSFEDEIPSSQDYVESPQEKAERIRRYEPIVDQIIDVFHGRVLSVQEK
ncbi:DNA polymerase III subunit gamma/tau [Planctomycetota bacterium]